MTSLTSKFADFAATISYKEIPQKAITAAKECITDGLGCAFAGSGEAAGKIITEYVQELGGKRQATVIAAGFKSSPPLAALSNGIMVHALDYDDACVGVAWHPTSVLLPPVLALGELQHATGKDVIQAYIVGLEVGVRLGRAIRLHYFESGWHNTGTIGSIGATVAASRLFGLNAQQMMMALGIASSEVAGLKKNFGTMTKPFHAGNAAKNGITAALLAGNGFTAGEDILAGDMGLCRTLGGDDAALAEESKMLGSSYELISPGILLKAYAACYDTHRCTEATLFLKKEHGFSAEDVLDVQLETRPGVSKRLPYHQPKTGLQGKFSLEYCVAVALLDGEAGLHQFTDERASDFKVQQLLQRVRYVPTVGKGLEEHQPDPIEGVTIKLRDGRQYSHRVSAVKGHPRNPMTKEERFSKYRECARIALSEEQIKRSYALLSNLEALKDITELTDVIKPQARR